VLAVPIDAGVPFTAALSCYSLSPSALEHPLLKRYRNLLGPCPRSFRSRWADITANWGPRSGVQR
jgi:hypothetical protein